MAEQYAGAGTQLVERSTHSGAESEGTNAGVVKGVGMESGAGVVKGVGIESGVGVAKGAGMESGVGAGAGAVRKPVPFAAVSFVAGLVGLLVANLLLGPLAIVLGIVGLRADANRRVRASLGILLGVADIAVFLLLAAHAGAHHGSLSWNFLGN